MGNTYIAYDVNNKPTAVLMAKSSRDAKIALAHMKTEAHRIEEIDPDYVLVNNEVVFLLTSTENNSNDYSHRIGGVSFRDWKRGI